jgi:hypothetical protein
MSVPGIAALSWLCRRTARLVLLAALVTAMNATNASAQPNYGHTVVSSSSVRFHVNGAPWADVHYIVNTAGQQDFRMAHVGNDNTYTLTGIPPAATVRYFFTISDNVGGSFVTPWVQFNISGAPTPRPRARPTPRGRPTPTPTPTPRATPPVGNGRIPVVFQNNTRGTWSNAQIYVLILGMPSPGEWHYLKSNGVAAHINAAEANAPGHLTKRGVNYANMSFTLAQASSISIPTRWEGGRIYVSIGSPLYIPISPDNRGWGGPDLRNPNDPNADVYYDWYELTYWHNVIPFGGNTTQVDQFGFPMTARLQQASIGYDETVGITLSRSEVRSRYLATVGSAFDGLANPYRIVAPRSSNAFRPGGAQASYMQAQIDQTWNFYTSRNFTLTRLHQTFTGRVVDGRLRFTKDGVGPFFLRKPTTTDVFECSGALASAGMATTELELGAEFCAAFNRGIAMNPSLWWGSPSAYYPGGIKNDYAMFFHQVGIAGRAYGFAYDDINDQSSVKILPNAAPPSRLTIGIGW